MSTDVALDPRQRLLGRILAELERSGTRYALIHSGGDQLPRVTSDVDIAFEAPPPLAIEPILLRFARDAECEIVQRLHYDIPHAYYYILRVPGDTLAFLHLDCLCDPIGVNRYRFPSPYLLEGAIKGVYGTRTGARREGIYLLMKRAVKGKVTQEGLTTLRDRFAAIPALWDDVDRWFGEAARNVVERLLACTDPQAARPVLADLSAKAASVAKRNPGNRIRRFFLEARRTLLRFVRPTGFFLVLVGPDGAGKSTVTATLLDELERSFRRTWRFHWRPGLLPKLGRGSGAPSTAADAAPAETSKYRGFISLARFIYYWLDFVLGYWLRIYPRRAQSTFIVGERYFPDVLVHPARYGFAVPGWLMRWAAKWVPSPDLLVVLSDDPQAIYARKAELGPLKIAQQIEAYTEEAEHWSPSVVINTSDGAARVARRIEDIVIDACCSRTLSRSGAVRASAHWRAFPSVPKVKVWVNCRDTIENALHLYHPYSSLALMARAFIIAFPEILYRRLLTGIPPSRVESRLATMTGEIQEILGRPDAVVSFYAGTPGPHQKSTAQVTLDGTIAAYVKVSHAPHVRGLLEREARMLKWLQAHDFNAVAYPRVLGFEERAGHTYLLLTPPPEGSGKRRRGTMNTDDIRFLLAAGTLAQGVRPVQDVFEHMHLDAYLASIPPHTAEILRQGKTAVARALSAGVKVNASHGDFGPWNTLELNDGRMFLFDWEYGDEQMPALYDFFHRILAPARLLEHRAPAHALADLMNYVTEERIGRVLDDARVARHELLAYLILYFLDQLARRPNDLPQPIPFLVEGVRLATAWMEADSRPPKVLVAAYACEPGKGSEPGVGWWMCQAISREHEVWVITRRNNRERIERALRDNPNPRLHFVYTDLPAWAMTWKRNGRFIRTYYYLWQMAAYREARGLMKTIDFNFAHHVTFVNDYTFTFLALLNLPFVWGPIGSNALAPSGLLPNRKGLLRDRITYYSKAILRNIDPLMWFCVMRARLIIGNSDQVRARLPFSLLATSKLRIHTAIGVERNAMLGAHGADERGFHVVSTGNLIPIKQFHLTVRAFARLAEKLPGACLSIVGTGPEKAKLVELAETLGIGGKVAFLGWLPRADALAVLASADVFLFPSTEAAGMVVLEAQANGVPVVALRGTGPGEMITGDSGIAVAPGSVDATVDRLGRALMTLAGDPELRRRMGTAARRLIEEHYVWEERHRAIRVWYRAAGVLKGVVRPSSALPDNCVP